MTKTGIWLLALTVAAWGRGAAGNGMAGAVAESPEAADVVYRTGFDDGLPVGWSVADGGADGRTWTASNPGRRTHASWRGAFMIVDSDKAGGVFMDEALISPPLDCSSFSSVRLRFAHRFNYYWRGGPERASVDVRVGSGPWQPVAVFDKADEAGTVTLDLSSLADGRSDVQVRWRYYDACYDWYWGVDDVEIAGVRLMAAHEQPATPPRWWAEQGVLDSTNAPNDYAAANAGQLKWIASRARAAMDTALPGGAGRDVADLVDGFSTNGNFHAVNVGQVKAVAKPFYDRFGALGRGTPYPWGRAPVTNDFAVANIGQVKNAFRFHLSK